MYNVFKKQNQNLRLDDNYIQFLTDIKEKLSTTQLRLARVVAHGIVEFYWKLGKELLEKQKTFKWGQHFLTQFSQDICAANPNMQGFSVRNLERMRQFASLYPSIAAQAVPQLPWGHIVVLIQKINVLEIREWYAEQTIKNGWSRSILKMQIESDLYERQGTQNKKISNFHHHLPKLQSDLAHEMLKDPYSFDFLTIQGKAHERAIEDALLTHIRDFILELGQGFAFVGSQVPLIIDEQEFFIDLLFYHLRLRSYVVIELKATPFTPEHTGQLGFYLAATDDLLRQEGDNQTIGILLCQSKNKIVAEYALKNMNAPIGISEYALSKALPKELKTDLPSIEEIETELNYMKETIHEYQNHIVLYMDILGFKDIIAIKENFKKILKVLKYTNRAEKEQEISVDQKNNIIDILIQPKVTTFSDHIVISINIENLPTHVNERNAAIEIINHLIKIIIPILTEAKFIFRGAITIGELYHQNGIVFGPALISAYEMESKQAIYPRIIVDNTIANYFSKRDELSHDEDDNRYYIDYLTILLNHADENIDNILKSIDEIIKKEANNTDPKILKKMIWLEKYFLRISEKYNVIKLQKQKDAEMLASSPSF